MRVLFDATAIPGDRAGVGRYVDNLVPALVRAGVDLVVACQPRDTDDFSGIAETVTASRLTGRASTRLLWEQAGFAALARSVAPDVVHSPHYTMPLAVRRPQVVTLHDATFFTDPDVHTRAKGPIFRRATRIALARASRCITPSRATANELVRVARANPAKLVVAHLGVDHTRFAPPSAESVTRVREWLGLAPDEPFISFLGTLEPRKNIPALIDAWTRVSATSANPAALVVAGAAGWDATIDAAAARVPAGLKLLRPGYVPLDLLPAVLGGATVVAYPSLGEGFGLPVLEAMACGAPVLTTRMLSLPEVGGDAVAYCGTDVPGIANELAALLADAPRREELSAAAITRAAGFTWDATAAAHVRAYEAAVQ